MEDINNPMDPDEPSAKSNRTSWIISGAVVGLIVLMFLIVGIGLIGK